MHKTRLNIGLAPPEARATQCLQQYLRRFTSPEGWGNFDDDAMIFLRTLRAKKIIWSDCKLPDDAGSFPSPEISVQVQPVVAKVILPSTRDASTDLTRRKANLERVVRFHIQGNCPKVDFPDELRYSTVQIYVQRLRNVPHYAQSQHRAVIPCDSREPLTLLRDEVMCDPEYPTPNGMELNFTIADALRAFDAQHDFPAEQFQPGALIVCASVAPASVAPESLARALTQLPPRIRNQKQLLESINRIELNVSIGSAKQARVERYDPPIHDIRAV